MKAEVKRVVIRDLRERTKHFALRVIRLYAALPRTTVAQTIGKQVLKSGTSVGAHYSEAHRGRSDAECISKIEGALQEMEETRYWLDLLVEAEIVPSHKLDPLHKEAEELTAILVTCARKVKKRREGREGRNNDEGRRVRTDNQ